MPVTIDRESRQRERVAIDINYTTSRYKTANGYFTFPAPSLTTIDKNLFYLLRNSREIDFEQKYKYRPDYLSFDEYGTVALAQLLMYVNAVSSIEEFDLQKVVIPEYSAIIEILKDRIRTQDVEDIDEVTW
jgi:hypothetical protein